MDHIIGVPYTRCKPCTIPRLVFGSRSTAKDTTMKIVLPTTKQQLDWIDTEIESTMLKHLLYTDPVHVSICLSLTRVAGKINVKI